MKKLTAGIFAGILTIVTVNAADAAIASKAYVDQKHDESMGSIVSNANEISDLRTTVGGHTTSINTLKGTVGDDTKGLVKDLNDLQGKVDSLSGDGTGSVADQIDAAISDTLGDGWTDGATVKSELDKKQDKLGSANVVKGTDGSVVKSVTANNGTVTVDFGTIGADDLAANAVTTAKIANGNVTSEKLDTTVQAALTKADSALQKSGTLTQGNLVKVGADGTIADGGAFGALANKNAVSESDLDGDLSGKINGKQTELVSTGDNANIKATGGGNAFTSVTAADGTVTFGTINAVTVPVSDEPNEEGTYVLTATVGDDGAVEYHWENIQRRLPEMPI